MSSHSFAAWRPTSRGLLMIAGAILAGLVLFFIVMSGQKRTAPAPVRATADAPDFAPLPAPMAGGRSDGASGMEEPDADALADQPRLEEAPRRTEPRPEAAPVAPPPSAAPAFADSATPTPISKPSPRYPSRAMRMRESGTVRVLVNVGIDGVPTDVSVESTSQSRDLDRAALEAVRKWRFKPATRNGQPIAGTVVVPIEFKL